MNADKILAIPVTEPERLFSSPDAYKDEFRALAKKWHPDAGGHADVFDRIAKLYDAAAAKVTKGEWHTPGLLMVHTSKGKDVKIRYLKKHATETGEMFISRTMVTHATRNDFADVVHSAKKIIGGFTYASDRMRKEISRYLPVVSRAFDAGDVQYMIMDKTPDLILLRDVINHYGGKIDPKHAAWIISSMLNLACYFEYAGLVHNAIGPDTYFISPPHHSGVLLGGWWYACKEGAKMVALPARTTRVMPVDILTKKKAEHRTDLTLIRAAGREMLGDPVGTRLDGVPKAMSQWLRYASSGSALKDYEEWGKVLTESFGPRRFTEMKIEASDIYRRD